MRLPRAPLKGRSGLVQLASAVPRPPIIHQHTRMERRAAGQHGLSKSPSPAVERRRASAYAVSATTGTFDADHARNQRVAPREL